MTSMFQPSPSLISSPQMAVGHYSPKIMQSPTLQKKKTKLPKRLGSFFGNLGKRKSEKALLSSGFFLGRRPVFDLMLLPRDVKSSIFSFLSFADLTSISFTCKELHQLVVKDNNLLWKEICFRKWPNLEKAESSLVQSTKHWRAYYYMKYAILAPLKTACFSWKINYVATHIPSARQSLSATTIHNDKIVFIGGQTSVFNRFDEAFVFNGNSKSFSKLNITSGTLPKFARHASAAIGDKVYVFGGYDGVNNFFGLSILDTSNSTWINNLNLEKNGPCPIPRTNHQMVSHGKNVYLFGGNDTTRCINTGTEDIGGQFGTFGDFWVLDTVNLTWSQPQIKGAQPCARSGHQMVVICDKIFVFGGGLWNDKKKEWHSKFNDMWMLDILSLEWKEIVQNSPPANAFISLPCWSNGTFIFVYNDSLYCFDTLVNSWSSVYTKGGKPQKRFLGSAAFIPAKKAAYMFGGVYNEVVNCFDELTISPPKHFMSSMRRIEETNLIEEELSVPRS